MGSSEHEYRANGTNYKKVNEVVSGLGNQYYYDAKKGMQGGLTEMSDLQQTEGARSVVKNGWDETDGERKAREDAFESNGADKRALERTQQLAGSVAAQPNAQMQNVGWQDSGLNAQSRAQQQGLAQMLMQRANGQGGPSAAQGMLQQGRDQAIQNALAIANSGRGGNRGFAMRQAQMAGAQAMQSAAGQAAILRAQEQQQATGQLAGALQGMRDQDLGMRAQDIGLRGQDIGIAGNNLAANIQQNQYRNNMMSQLGTQQFAYDAMERDQNIQRQQYMDQIRAQEEAMARNYAQNQQQNTMTGVGAGLTALGTVAGIAASMSDERVKTNIGSGAKSLDQFLSSINAHEYEYKEPGKPLRGEGKFVSPMAQELERTELGKSMVKDTPDGKVVDYGKGLGMYLAALADQHKRIKKLEGGGK